MADGDYGNDENMIHRFPTVWYVDMHRGSFAVKIVAHFYTSNLGNSLVYILCRIRLSNFSFDIYEHCSNGSYNAENEIH